MPTKPTKNVYPATSKLIPKTIADDIENRKVVKDEDCPWVKVGNVYLSVTVTGENSWLPIARYAYDEGARSFTIFTGRHGDYLNPYKKGACGMFDPNHTKEDQERVKGAKAELKEATFKLLDTSTHAKDQAKWLRAETEKALKAGEAVIYAWCYSLFTFSEVDIDKVSEKDEARRRILVSNIQAIQAKNIAAVVQDWFHWVK